MSDGGNERFLPTGAEAGSAPEDRAFRPDVEGLRAIAVILVILFHVDTNLMQGGFAGVDVFFVVSGFVITGLLLRERAVTGKNRLTSFYARRARRILPAALLVIMLSLIATDLFVGANRAVLVASDSRWTAVFLGNFHFESVLPKLFSMRPQSPLEHFWSLAVEEQFYLVYPAFFIALLAVPGRWSTRARLGVGLTVVALTSFIASGLTSRAGEFAAFYSPFTRAWEFAVGGLVAVGTRQLERLPSHLAAAMTWVGVVGIVLCVRILSLRIPFPGYVAALPVMSAAFVIAGGCVAPRLGAEALLRLPPFRWLGRWSYSLYLWHWPVLAIADAHYHEQVAGSPVSRNAVLAILTVPLAAASYFLAENPVRHSRRLKGRDALTLAGAIALVASCVAVTFAF